MTGQVCVMLGRCVLIYGDNGLGKMKSKFKKILGTRDGSLVHEFKFPTFM